MYNDLFSIGPVTVHGYGLMIGIGVVAALLVSDRRAKKKGLNGDLIYNMAIISVVIGFLCARLLFIITEWDNFLANPKAYMLGGGFVVYGGIIGGALSLMAYCRYKKLDTWAYIDLLVPAVAMAQGFGRIGCFLAGCCYGKETDCFLGVVFKNSKYAPNNVKLLPSQLFSSAGDFLLAAFLFWYSSRNPRKGKTSILYLMLYSVGRFLVEFTRNDPRGSVGIFSTSQFIGMIVFLITAGIYFFYPWDREKKEAEN